MITDSFDYLRNSENALETVLYGGILMAFSWLLIPLFLVLGYVVRVIRLTSTGDEEPPVFDDWADLGVEGAKAFAIQFVYGVVPAVIGVVFAAFGVLGVASGSESGAALGGAVAVVGLLVAFGLGLLAAYLTPAAIANFADVGTLRAGFAFGDLRPVWTDPVYARAWLLGLVVVFAAAVVGTVASVVPILGQILTAFVTFYGLVAAYYIIGHAWGDLREREPGDSGGRADEQPAV